MSDLEYCEPKTKEWICVFYIIIAFSFMFSIAFLRFEDNYNFTFFGIFFIFFLFFMIMFTLRLLFMKYVAMRQGFKLIIQQSFFDRYWIHSYDKISYRSKSLKTNSNNFSDFEKNNLKFKEFKGIPASLISILIYILTLGFIIYPSMWSYRTEKIPHLHIGTQSYNEVDMIYNFNMGISDYRISKVYIIGFLYYFVFGFILKLLFKDFGLYGWFVFALYWIALFTIIPIPGSEGFELFRRNNLAWILILSVLIAGMISLLVFQSIWYTILIMTFTFLVVLFIRIWDKMGMRDHY